MSRILFTTMPLAGHLRPGLPIARRLVGAGHEVAWYTGRKYAHLAEATGARVVPITGGLDFDDADIDAVGDRGERVGLAMLRNSLRTIFIDPIPGWVSDLGEFMDEWRPDVVVAEHGFMSGPLAAELRGVPSVIFSVSPLGISSVDTAPFGTGLVPAAGPVGRLRNRVLNRAMKSLVFGGAQRAAEEVRARIGLPPSGAFLMDWGAEVATRYLMPCPAEFEYPRRDLPANVEFVGPFLPEEDPDWTPPAWWPDVEAARLAGRPVVLVTQGTVATDPGNLVVPAVRALAERDVLVVATTVGFDAGAALPDRPANLRLAEFVPFRRLLPSVDVLVTNGGYGGVQLGLAHGVPLVVAGTTEDKMEVSARVTWAGVGIALRTDRPTPEQLENAVDNVLLDPGYRERARVLQAAYARCPGASRAAEVILEVAGQKPGQNTMSASRSTSSSDPTVGSNTTSVTPTSA